MIGVSPGPLGICGRKEARKEERKEGRKGRREGGRERGRKYKTNRFQEEGTYVGISVSRDRGWADWRDRCWLSSGNQLNMEAGVPMRRQCVCVCVGTAVQKQQMLRFIYGFHFSTWNFHLFVHLFKNQIKITHRQG